MSVAKPRNRLVYFRVSEDEFQKLSRMCQGNEGARSISELARSAVNRMLAEQNGESSSVDHKLEILRAQIGTLTELLAASELLRGRNPLAPPDSAETAAPDTNGL